MSSISNAHIPLETVFPSMRKNTAAPGVRWQWAEAIGITAGLNL
jgi:hypothetical protein